MTDERDIDIFAVPCAVAAEKFQFVYVRDLYPIFQTRHMSENEAGSTATSSMDSTATSVENKGDIGNGTANPELDRIKTECRAMVTYLKRLRAEEEDLRDKNIMLAREALLCGFQVDNLEPPLKRGRGGGGVNTTAKGNTKDEKAATPPPPQPPSSS